MIYRVVSSRIVIIALIASVIAFGASATRADSGVSPFDIVHQQIAALAGLAPLDNWPQMDHGRLPASGDYRPALARALSEDETEAVQGAYGTAAWPHTLALMKRYPDAPGIMATLLRHQISSISTDQPDVALLRGVQPTPNASASGREMLFLNQMIAETLYGERMDPRNAFFPYMHAVLLFDEHKEAAACVAMLAASRYPDWNEYLYDEETGQLALMRGPIGVPRSLADAVIDSSVLFPQYGWFRAAARSSAYNAMLLEEHGDADAGLRLRLAAMRLGDQLWSGRGEPVMGALVGVFIDRDAMQRPGGVPYVKKQTKVGAPDPVAAAFGTWLTSRSFPTAEVSAARSQMSRAAEAESDLSKANIMATVDRMMLDLGRVAIWWTVSLVLVETLLTLVLIGLIAGAFARRRGSGEEAVLPQPYVDRRSTFATIVLAIVAIVGLTGWFLHAERSVFAALMVAMGVLEATGTSSISLSTLLWAVIPWSVGIVLTIVVSIVVLVRRRARKPVGSVPEILRRWSFGAAILVLVAYAWATMKTASLDRYADAAVRMHTADEMAFIEARSV